MITTTDAARGFQPAAALDGLADGIIVTDAATGPEGPVIVYVNRAACDITGYEPGELIGRSPKLLQGPDTDPAVMRHLSADLAAGRTFNGQTVNYRKDGTPFVMEWSIATLLDDDDRPAFFVAVQRDATLPSRRLLAAEREARTDPLTTSSASTSPMATSWATRSCAWSRAGWRRWRAPAISSRAGAARSSASSCWASGRAPRRSPSVSSKWSQPSRFKRRRAR